MEIGRALPGGESRQRAGEAGRNHRAGRNASARNSTPPRRKLPPYGRLLAAVLARPDTWPRYIGTSPDGRHVHIEVLCGADCWDWAYWWADHGNRLFVVLPPGEDPDRFDWRLLQGHDPVPIQPVGDVDGASVQGLAAALIRDGVQRVLYCGPRGATRYAAPVAGRVRHSA